MSEQSNKVKSSGTGYSLVVFASCVVICALVLVPKVFAPTDQRLLSVPDDAFYYFRIAENRAKGLGWTVDGENPTTGFQPGYAALLCLVVRTLGAGHDAIPTVAGALCAVMLLASAFCAYFAARQVLSAAASWCVAGLWLLVPYSVRTTATCMESASVLLASTLIAGCWLRNTKSALSGQPVTMGAAVLPALSSAVGLLCRTDLVFLTASMGAVSIVLWLADRRRTGHLYTAAGLALGSIAGVIAVAAFCHSVTGKLTQDSGRMKLFWASYAHGSGLGRWLFRWKRFSWQCTSMLLSPFWPREWSPERSMLIRQLAAIVLLVVAACVAAVFVRSLAKPSLALVVSAVGLLHVIAYAAFLGLFMEHVQETWYFASVQVGLALIAGGVLATSMQRQSRQVVEDLRLKHALACLAAAALMVIVGSRRDMRYWQMPAACKASLKLKNVLPRDARIGSWNAGVIGFYSGLKVINLDGVVNTNVEPYARRRAMGEYILDNGIDWIVDLPGQPCGRLQVPLFSEEWMNAHMERVAPRNVPGLDTDALRIWRVKPGNRRMP